MRIDELPWEVPGISIGRIMRYAKRYVATPALDIRRGVAPDFWIFEFKNGTYTIEFGHHEKLTRWDKIDVLTAQCVINEIFGNPQR